MAVKTATHCFFPTKWVFVSWCQASFGRALHLCSGALGSRPFLTSFQQEEKGQLSGEGPWPSVSLSHHMWTLYLHLSWGFLPQICLHRFQKEKARDDHCGSLPTHARVWLLHRRQCRWLGAFGSLSSDLPKGTCPHLHTCAVIWAAHRHPGRSPQPLSQLSRLLCPSLGFISYCGSSCLQTLQHRPRMCLQAGLPPVGHP